MTDLVNIQDNDSQHKADIEILYAVVSNRALRSLFGQSSWRSIIVVQTYANVPIVRRQVGVSSSYVVLTDNFWKRVGDDGDSWRYSLSWKVVSPLPNSGKAILKNAQWNWAIASAVRLDQLEKKCLTSSRDIDDARSATSSVNHSLR